MTRRALTLLHGAIAILMVATAGWMWTATFGSSMGSRLVAAAILGVIPPVLMVAFGRRPTTLLSTAPASLVVALLGCVLLAAIGWNGNEGFGLAAQGIVRGWGRILSYSPPVPIRPDLVVLPLVCVAVAGWVTVELLLRTARVTVVLVPSLLVWGLAIFLGKSGLGAPEMSSGLWAGVALLSVAVRTRQREALSGVVVARMGFETDSDVVDGWVGNAFRRALPVALVAVVGAALVAAALPGRKSIQERNHWKVPAKTRVSVDPLSYVTAAKTSKSMAFSVELSRAVPDARFRMLVLDRFDGRSWASSALGESAGSIESGSAAELTGGAVIQRLKTYEPLPGIPALDRVVSVSGRAAADGRLRFDRQTASLLPTDDQPIGLTIESRLSADGASSDMQNLALDTSPQSIAATTPSVALPPALAAVKKQIFSGAPSQFAQVARLVGFFTNVPGANFGGRFAVDPKAPTGHTLTHLNQFVSSSATRKGTEEQFITTAAVLARAGGLPARIAIGYRPPPSAKNSTKIVMPQKSLTAWLEIPFVGRGWIAFDPIPRDGTSRAPKTKVEDVIARTVKPAPQSSGPSGARPAGASGPSAEPLEPKKGGSRHVGVSGPSGVTVVLLILALLASLAVASPWLLKSLRRRRRRTSGDSAARMAAGWDEAVDRMVDSGIAVPGSLTISEVVATGVSTDRVPQDELALLATTLSSAMYRAAEPSEEEAGQLWAEVDQFLRTYRKNQSSVERLKSDLSVRSLARR